MKKIYLLLGFVVCALASCLEDKGNELYIELNDVTVERIRDTTVEQFTRLKIEPEITTSTGEFDEENYTYLWYMYTTWVGTPTSADTLSLEKNLDVEINSAVAVVDASKCKMYMKNFGEFFSNQIEYAGTIILSRTDKVDQAKLNACVEMIREHNDKATIITTPLDQLDGREVLKTIEGADKLEDMMKEMLEHIHDDHDEDECCDHEHHHHHDHDEDDHDHECCCGHHHDDDDDDDEHEHHHHHDHDEDHDHEHHHEHDENCTCGCHDHDHDHHHHHHHADEVFTSWGIETPNTYSAEDIEKILTALDSGEYGAILRAKGMVPAPDGTWVYYDYVPEEHDIRSGKPEVTGKICVIGSKLDEDKLAELFRK